MTDDEIQQLLYSNIRSWDDMTAVAAIYAETYEWRPDYITAICDHAGAESRGAMREAIAYCFRCEWTETTETPDVDVDDDRLLVYVRNTIRTRHNNETPDAESLNTFHRLWNDHYQDMHPALQRLTRAQRLMYSTPHHSEKSVRLEFERDEAGKKTGVSISYYQDLAKAVRDIRTSTTPERYGARVLDLDADNARDFGKSLKALVLDVAQHLHFARTVEEIQHVYDNGPSSCMQADFSRIEDMHLEVDGQTVTSPVACYASPDLAVAYLKRGSRITARAVVNMNERTWSRIYGDVETLYAALTAADFTHDMYALEGCRILHLERGGLRLQPFVDYAGAGYNRKDPYGNNASSEWGQLHVKERIEYGDDIAYRRISRHYGTPSNYETGFARGYDDDHSWTCDHCDDTYDEDVTSYDAVDRHGGGITICERCVDSVDFVYARGHHHHETPTHIDYVVTVDDTQYNADYAPDHTTCSHCGGNFTETHEVINDGYEETTVECCENCCEGSYQIVGAQNSEGDTVYAYRAETVLGRDGNRYTHRAHNALEAERLQESGEGATDERAA